MNTELFQKHFNFQGPSFILKTLYRTDNKMKNNDLVNLIKSGLSDLKDEIKKTSENEKEIEDADKMVNIVEIILECNKQNEQGQGLKLLALDQILSILPNSLAQLKTGNNSNEIIKKRLKNEIRQLLYSLYQQKRLA